MLHVPLCSLCLCLVHVENEHCDITRLHISPSSSRHKSISNLYSAEIHAAAIFKSYTKTLEPNLISQIAHLTQLRHCFAADFGLVGKNATMEGLQLLPAPPKGDA